MGQGDRRHVTCDIEDYVFYLELLGHSRSDMTKFQILKVGSECGGVMGRLEWAELEIARLMGVCSNSGDR